MLCREIAATGSGCICVASQFRKKYREIVCCLTRSIILWHKSNYLKIINTIVGIIYRVYVKMSLNIAKFSSISFLTLFLIRRIQFDSFVTIMLYFRCKVTPE